MQFEDGHPEKFRSFGPFQMEWPFSVLTLLIGGMCPWSQRARQPMLLLQCSWPMVAACCTQSGTLSTFSVLTLLSGWQGGYPTCKMYCLPWGTSSPEATLEKWATTVHVCVCLCVCLCTVWWIYIRVYCLNDACNVIACIVGRTAGEVCSGVVNKCLNQRIKTKDLGMAVLMMYIEIEKQDIVQVDNSEWCGRVKHTAVIICIIIPQPIFSL